MANPLGMSLSLRETGALALDDAAAALDRALDAQTFVGALERTRRVWQALSDIARREDWQVPSPATTDYVIATAAKAGIGLSDEHITTLIDINRRVAAELCGGDIEHIRARAYFIWESRGRPQGEALDNWLQAESEMRRPRMAGGV